jgi:hypothetical protein
MKKSPRGGQRYIQYETSSSRYISSVRPPFKRGRDQRQEQWLSGVGKHTANVPLTGYVAIWVSVMVV